MQSGKRSEEINDDRKNKELDMQNRATCKASVRKALFLENLYSKFGKFWLYWDDT